MHRMSKKTIMEQFHFVLYCLLAMGLFLSLLSYCVMNTLISKNTEIRAQNISQKFNSEIDHLFKRADTIFINLLFDKNIEQLMHTPFSEDTPAYIRSLQSGFSSCYTLNPDVAEIALVTPDISWSSCFDYKTLQGLRLEMKDAHDTVCFGLMQTSLTVRCVKERPFLVFGHNVYGMHNTQIYGQYLGTLFLFLDLSRSSVLLPETDAFETTFLLLDQNTEPFLFNGDSNRYDTIYSQALKKGNGLWPEGTIRTNDYIIRRTTLLDSGISVITAMDRRGLKKESLIAIFFLVLTAIAALLFIIFLMRLILQRIIEPLEQLSEYINHIRGITLTEQIRMPALEGCKEIILLNTSFHNMLVEQARLSSQLQQATIQLYETQLRQKQAELEFLRSQINPHFLYNTLETIQGIATEKHVPEIAAAAGALGKLFRYNIYGNDFVSLEKELEITRAYLTIQKMRFVDRLHILMNIRDDTRDTLVMRLLLQPIVENAVYHGLETKTDGGTLYIGTRLENNDLIISIYDDGIGIDTEALESLRSSLAEATEQPVSGRSHIGILNVQNRIRLHYGSTYGIELQSAPGNGTQVTIRIPAHIKESEEQYD